MASKQTSDTVDKVLKITLQQFEEHEPAEFAKLKENPEQLKELHQVIRNAAEEYLTLEGIKDLHKNPDLLAKHLPANRIKMIKDGLTIHTYKMNIRQEAGTHFVDITRNGKEFKPSRELATLEDINWATGLQYASIVVEAVLLVLQAVGIKLDVSESVINEVAEQVAKVIDKTTAIQDAVQNLQNVFENPNSTTEDKAKAIFNLIGSVFTAGILWTIIHGLCTGMSAWEWTKTAAVVTTMIVAALATDGVALIAKIILALNSAYDFVKKLTNLTELDRIKKTK